MARPRDMFATELSYRALKFDETALRARRHVLHLDASHGPASICTQGAEALLARLTAGDQGLEVEHLRLWEDEARAKIEYDLTHVRAKMARLAGGTNSADEERFARIEALAVQIVSARGLVVSAPMWNYGVPYVLKQYFDCVLHPGLSFRETPSGPVGLLGGGKPLVIITSAGGAAKKDHLTPWLTDVAAMMGFDRPSVVSATSVAHEDREQVLERVTREAAEAGRQLLAEAAGVAPLAPVGGPEEDWGEDELAEWLRAQGGVSDEAVEALACSMVTGGLWLGATEDDWRNEELGLEDVDVDRLLELQRVTRGDGPPVAG